MSHTSSTNVIDGTVDAFILNSAEVQSAGAVSVTADDKADVSATIVSVSLAVGLVGIAIGISLADNTVEDDVSASIGGSSVTAGAGDIEITANDVPTITTKSVVLALAAGPGVTTGAGAKSVVTIDGTTAANVDASTLSAVGHRVLVSADSTATADPSTTSVALALGEGVAISVLTSTATIAGATEATVTGASAITADGIDVLATAVNIAEPKVNVAAAGFAAGAVVISSSTISRATDAFVGDGASISAGSGTVTVLAETDSRAHGQSTGTTLGGAGLTVMRIDSTISGDTTAGIGAQGAVHAGAVTVSAQSTSKVDGSTVGLSLAGIVNVTAVELDATISGKTTANIGAQSSVDAASLSVLAAANNTADADVFAFSASFGVGATGVKARAEITKDAVTEAGVGADAQITLSGALNVNATAHNNAEASTRGGSGGVFAAVSAMLPEAHVGAATRATMDGDVLAASNVSVTANGANT
ncbi:MAG TPA: hypothetical protein VF892_03585, partial [Pseudonocardiaceae bacterium]